MEYNNMTIFYVRLSFESGKIHTWCSNPFYIEFTYIDKMVLREWEKSSAKHDDPFKGKIFDKCSEAREYIKELEMWKALI